MNKRYAAAAKFAAAALFSILAVVLAASIFVMIVSANERYRVAGDFAQFLYWLYTLRGAATAAGVMSAAAVFSMILPAMRQNEGGIRTNRRASRSASGIACRWKCAF